MSKQVVEIKQFPYVIVNGERIENMKQMIDRIMQFKNNYSIVDDGGVEYTLETEWENDNTQDKPIGERLIRWGKEKTEYISMNEDEYNYFCSKQEKKISTGLTGTSELDNIVKV